MKIIDYEDDLRDRIDTLSEGLDYVRSAIESLSDHEDYKDLVLDLRDDIAGWDDILEQLEDERDEIDRINYENEMKERNREYDSQRL